MLGSHTRPAGSTIPKTAAREARVGACPGGMVITGVIFTIELEREEDGRWIAEVPALSGVLCYGRDRDQAVAGVQALALRVIAERATESYPPLS